MPSSSGDVSCGGGCACAGNSVYGESLSSVQLCCEPHCLKEKSLKKKYCREKSGVTGLIKSYVECMQFLFGVKRWKPKVLAGLLMFRYGVIARLWRLYALRNLKGSWILQMIWKSQKLPQDLSLKIKPWDFPSDMFAWFVIHFKGFFSVKQMAFIPQLLEVLRWFYCSLLMVSEMSIPFRFWVDYDRRK